MRHSHRSASFRCRRITIRRSNSSSRARLRDSPSRLSGCAGGIGRGDRHGGRIRGRLSAIRAAMCSGRVGFIGRRMRDQQYRQYQCHGHAIARQRSQGRLECTGTAKLGWCEDGLDRTGAAANCKRSQTVLFDGEKFRRDRIVLLGRFSCRDRRAVQPARPDGRASFLAVRHAGSGERSKNAAQRRRDDQRPRAVCPRTRDRPLARGGARPRHPESRDQPRSRRCAVGRNRWGNGPVKCLRPCTHKIRAAWITTVDVRFTPGSGGRADIREGPRWATNGRMHCSNSGSTAHRLRRLREKR
jgi:hypothetical protein